MRRAKLSWLLENPMIKGRARRKLLALIVRMEGGEMTSLSLRRLLSSQYNVHVGPYSYGSLLNPGNCDRYTWIGSYVSIGPNVRRFGAAHPLDRLSLHPYFYNPSFGIAQAEDEVARSQLVIGSDVWIGANVTILPGCTKIGIGAVIGAGSVVTRDVPDYAICTGNPGRVRRYRFDDDERRRLLSLAYWELAPHELENLLKQPHRPGYVK
jgi:virginiamycin A acetyltransferase